MSAMDAIVTAAVVIESIWPPPSPGSPEYHQKNKGLPLRTFVQETLKRSRSSYSTLQTALFYLYKIRNKVPDMYLRRREEQALLNHQRLAAAHPPAGMMTPPASPHHFVPSASDLSSTDYFSLHANQARTALPSPLSSTCSMTSASPRSEYCPSESSPVSSTASSPASDSGSPCSDSSSSSSSVSSSSTSSSANGSATNSNQSNRIIYCGRRTFLAALMVASKYLQDRNYSNKAWAKISGLSIKEINANELIFLKLIDYNLFVSHETFMRWTGLLVAHGREATRKFMRAANPAMTGSSDQMSTNNMINNKANEIDNSGNMHGAHHSHNVYNHSKATVRGVQRAPSATMVLNSHNIRYANTKSVSMGAPKHHLPPSPLSDPEEPMENTSSGFKQAKIPRLSDSRVNVGICDGHS
ncbi:hypothetical protein BGZ94_008652 [Podila epigama]|nr:hypothetical protein BGZ94_008652 [Podila epigama]